jgi:ABC-type Zn uptake system ZnuABC Zn-binding protein ZnuA
MAALIEKVRASGAPAIFLETGADPRLADQIAQETGVKLITGLYSHSVTEPGGNAPTYIDMMKYNTMLIVGALK